MLKKFVLGGVAALVLAACGNEGGSAAQSAASAPATAAEGSLLARIDNKGTVTVGTEGTYAPFTYHDESGKLTGYDVEVTRAVADKLGVKVDFKETQWDAMLAGLKAGRFDIVANQVSLTTPERRATFDKSADYSYSGPMALTRQDDQRIKTLADVKGLSSAQSLSSNYGEMAEKAGAKIVPVDGMAQALALAICCATRKSSVMVTTEASEVSLNRLIKVLLKGGTDTRKACGMMMRRKVCI